MMHRNLLHIHRRMNGRLPVRMVRKRPQLQGLRGLRHWRSPVQDLLWMLAGKEQR